MGNSKSSIKLDETFQDITVQAFQELLDNDNNADSDLYIKPDFTKKVEKTIQMLIRSERYEAVFPLSRMVIPILEKELDYEALRRVYAQLETTCKKAAEVKKDAKRHFGTYFRVVFHGQSHFGSEDKTEWVYREPGLISLAEACERMTEHTRRMVGHGNVEVVSEKQIDLSKLKNSFAYVQMTHVEPFLSGDDPVKLMVHTNIRKFFYEEAIVDESVPIDAPEWARLSLKKVFLTVDQPFPSTRSRQRIVQRDEKILNPLELACDSLQSKEAQLRKNLDAAGIKPGTAIDKAALGKLDLKGLQLILQGTVSPSVNVGPLVYAETFTAPAQRERYGPEGIAKLVLAFKGLMTELSEALRVNEAAIGTDQLEYQKMLKDSFDAMLIKLSTFFNFILEIEDWPKSHCGTTKSPNIQRIYSIPKNKNVQLRPTSYSQEIPRQSRNSKRNSMVRHHNSDLVGSTTPKRSETPAPRLRLYNTLSANQETPIRQSRARVVRYHNSDLGRDLLKRSETPAPLRFYDSTTDSQETPPRKSRTSKMNGMTRHHNNDLIGGSTPKRSKTPAPNLRFYYIPSTDISNITPGKLPRNIIY